MRKVLIVGAGQSGLQLALTLLEYEYDVTVMSARTPEEIRNGRVMSTQGMFHPALRHERDHGLNLWDDEVIPFEGLGVSIAAPDGTRALDWVSKMDAQGMSIDQRVKMAGWLELFEDRGGRLVIHGVTTADLNALAGMYDLTVIAAGKGELVQLFDRDQDKSPFTSPQRALSLAYANGVRRRPEHPEFAAVRFNIVPGVGELFMIPCLTVTGNCDILFFEGIPGGPLDVFGDRPSPNETLRRILELMRVYVPWEYERARGATLTDQGGALVGGYTPVVRRPVGELPSGRVVLGMADVVVANDPITGQGSNNASHCAQLYLEEIVARGDAPFDREWMTATFAKYWNYAQHVTRWTNAMLAPPPTHVLDIIGAAGQLPVVARRFANGFADPTDFQHWFLDPERAMAYLRSVSTPAQT
ncbi:styrene monooxygenase/indole monooxygenase family protein [Actinophytocola sediminis]